MDNMDTIISKVSEHIALGHGKRRPRLGANDFSGVVCVDGKWYRVKARWFDGQYAHEVKYEAKEMK